MTLAHAIESATRPPVRTAPKRPSRYTPLLALSESDRAETAIAVREDAVTLEELIVVKSFRREASADGSLMDELELYAALEHENIARALSLGFEAGRYFVVSAYVEGVPLPVLLERARRAPRGLPSAALLRITVAALRAMEHASRAAPSEGARALVQRPVLARDVFITYDGGVKLLGFKAPLAAPGAATTRSAPEELAALPALAATPLEPELAAQLATLAAAAATSGAVGLEAALGTLSARQRALGDGRAELAGFMEQHLGEPRARQASRLLSAFNALGRRPPRRAPSYAEAHDAEAPPASGYRARAARHVDAPPGAASTLGSSALALAAERDTLAPANRTRPLSLEIGGAGVGPTGRRGQGHAGLWLVISGVVALCAAYGARAPRTPEAAPAAAAADAVEAQAIAGHVAAAPEREPAPRDHAAPRITARDARTLGVSDGRPAVEEHTSGQGTVAPQSPASDVNGRVDDARTAPEALRVTRHRSRSGAAPRSRSGRHNAPVSSVEPGYLTLDTTPWSSVSLGGISLGQTPIVRAALPPGEHVLEFANAELGVRSHYPVTITSGHTTVRRIGIEAP